MLKFYLTSVIVYMIMIFAAAYIGQYKIKANGWLDDAKKQGSPWVYLFCISAVPIFRLLIVIVIFMMMSITKEDFDKYVDEVKNKSN